MPVSSALSPSDLLRAELAARGTSVEDFARRMGTATDTAQGLVDGTITVTEELSHKIGAALGSSPRLWLKLQQRYEHWVRTVANDSAITRTITT